MLNENSAYSSSVSTERVKEVRNHPHGQSSSPVPRPELKRAWPVTKSQSAVGLHQLEMETDEIVLYDDKDIVLNCVSTL